MKILKWFYYYFIKSKSLVEREGQYSVRYRFDEYQDFRDIRYRWTPNSVYFSSECWTTKDKAEKVFAGVDHVKVIR